MRFINIGNRQRTSVSGPTEDSASVEVPRHQAMHGPAGNGHQRNSGGGWMRRLSQAFTRGKSAKAFSQTWGPTLKTDLKSVDRRLGVARERMQTADPGSFLKPETMGELGAAVRDTHAVLQAETRSPRLLSDLSDALGLVAGLSGSDYAKLPADEKSRNALNAEIQAKTAAFEQSPEGSQPRARLQAELKVLGAIEILTRTIHLGPEQDHLGHAADSESERSTTLSVPSDILSLEDDASDGSSATGIRKAVEEFGGAPARGGVQPFVPMVLPPMNRPINGRTDNIPPPHDLPLWRLDDAQSHVYLCPDAPIPAGAKWKLEQALRDARELLGMEREPGTKSTDSSSFASYGNGSATSVSGTSVSGVSMVEAEVPETAHAEPVKKAATQTEMLANAQNLFSSLGKSDQAAYRLLDHGRMLKLFHAGAVEGNSRLAAWIKSQPDLDIALSDMVRDPKRADAFVRDFEVRSGDEDIRGSRPASSNVGKSGADAQAAKTSAPSAFAARLHQSWHAGAGVRSRTRWASRLTMDAHLPLPVLRNRLTGACRARPT